MALSPARSPPTCCPSLVDKSGKQFPDILGAHPNRHDLPVVTGVFNSGTPHLASATSGSAARYNSNEELLHTRCRFVWFGSRAFPTVGLVTPDRRSDFVLYPARCPGGAWPACRG